MCEAELGRLREGEGHPAGGRTADTDDRDDELDHLADEGTSSRAPEVVVTVSRRWLETGGAPIIQGRDPGNDLILIDRRGEHDCSSPTSTRPLQRRGRLGGSLGNDQNLVLVLETAATMKAPTT